MSTEERQALLTSEPRTGHSWTTTKVPNNLLKFETSRCRLLSTEERQALLTSEPRTARNAIAPILSSYSADVCTTTDCPGVPVSRLSRIVSRLSGRSPKNSSRGWCPVIDFPTQSAAFL